MGTEEENRELGVVLKNFMRGERLRQMPTKRLQRFVLLRYIRERTFIEDRVYTEREVNFALEKWYEDFAALRRYMVEENLMVRDHGEYRRGPVR